MGTVSDARSRGSHHDVPERPTAYRVWKNTRMEQIFETAHVDLVARETCIRGRAM